jgi:hypothetical protein
MLGHRLWSHPKEQEVTGQENRLIGSPNKMALRGREQRLVWSKLGPIGAVGRRRLGLKPIEIAPDPAQKAQTVAACAL